MSVFESIMVRSGRPVFLQEHLLRLSRSCAVCGFDFILPAAEEIENCLTRSAQTGLARLYVTAGDGSVATRSEHCRCILFIEPRQPIEQPVYTRGYEVISARGIYHPIFGGLKTANYWANIAALQQACPKDEALLFNERDELVSACMANVFVVQNGIIRTPLPVCGAREGIVREWIIRRENVEECRISRKDLNAATGIFLTSSWIGIMPAAALDGKPLSERSAAIQLQAGFEKLSNG